MLQGCLLHVEIEGGHGNETTPCSLFTQKFTTASMTVFQHVVVALKKTTASEYWFFAELVYTPM